MATNSLFWDTNMSVVTSCENTLYHNKVDYRFDVDDYPPLLTSSAVNLLLAIKSETKTPG